MSCLIPHSLHGGVSLKGNQESHILFWQIWAFGCPQPVACHYSPQHLLCVFLAISLPGKCLPHAPPALASNPPFSNLQVRRVSVWGGCSACVEGVSSAHSLERSSSSVFPPPSSLWASDFASGFGVVQRSSFAFGALPSSCLPSFLLEGKCSLPPFDRFFGKVPSSWLSLSPHFSSNGCLGMSASCPHFLPSLSDSPHVSRSPSFFCFLRTVFPF